MSDLNRTNNEENDFFSEFFENDNILPDNVATDDHIVFTIEKTNDKLQISEKNSLSPPQKKEEDPKPKETEKIGAQNILLNNFSNTYVQYIKNKMMASYYEQIYIKEFEKYLNVKINFDKNLKVPKNILIYLYEKFRDSEMYSDWPPIKSTCQRKRKSLLAKIFLKKDAIVYELEKRPHIFLKPVLEYIDEKERIKRNRYQ
ncbi:hypothetical protein M9Y10_020858 [Tritrichomonas musculus]|uniref:Uncharacterized protein n=1 Tax=Tritrichomonas musculus TaxID=1915356 RepID=A0ABR2HGS2_9EUKA